MRSEVTQGVVFTRSAKGNEKPQQGECFVDDGDVTRYFYRVARGHRRSFRRWAQYTFDTDGSKRLCGSWPAYYMEREDSRDR